jgi:hypothetical protein
MGCGVKTILNKSLTKRRNKLEQQRTHDGPELERIHARKKIDRITAALETMRTTQWPPVEVRNIPRGASYYTHTVVAPTTCKHIMQALDNVGVFEGCRSSIPKEHGMEAVNFRFPN